MDNERTIGLRIKARRALENEGFAARLNEQPFDANPYVRRSKEWEMWRLGWSRSDYTIWHDNLMAKRKASTE